MKRRFYVPRLLQVVAALVAGAGLLFYLFRAPTPKHSCRQELGVQFNDLPFGDYELGVSAEGYTNRCQLKQEMGQGLSGSCEKNEGVGFLAGLARLYLPAQPLQVDIDLRRDGVVLFAHRLSPVTHTQTDGCTSALIFVRPDIGPDAHAGKQNQ